MKCYIDNHNPAQKSYQDITGYIIRKRKTNRREIEAETGYSWGTVSSVVSLLLDSGLVEERDGVSAGQGRKARWLVPNGNKFAAVGIDLNSDSFTVTSMGIDGSILFQDEKPFGKDTMKEFLELFYLMLDDAITQTKKKRKIVSIGVSCQGAIRDDHSVFEHFSFVKDWKPFDIKSELESRYKIFTFVEHDTHCEAIDYTTSLEATPGQFILARVVSGIGFSVYSGGMFFERIAPIDFGHLIVVPDNGEPCQCGSSGCLEAYASSTGLIRRTGASSIEEIKANPSAYQSYLDDAAHFLGIAFANARRLFAFETIVLTGKVLECDPKMPEKISTVVSAYCQPGISQAKVLHYPSISASAGAAKLSIVERFGPNHLLI